jgi:nucleolar protein 58
MARMVATKAALSIRVDALTDAEGKSEPDAPTIGLENRAKLESRLRALEYQGDAAGARAFAAGPKKTAKFEMRGEAKTYNAAGDFVPTQREGEGETPVEKAMKAVLDVKEEKRRAKEERRAKRRAEKEKGKAKEESAEEDEDEEAMDVDGEESKEKKRKRRESDKPPVADVSVCVLQCRPVSSFIDFLVDHLCFQMEAEETEAERKARKKAKKAEKAAAAAAVAAGELNGNSPEKKKKKRKSEAL